MDEKSEVIGEYRIGIDIGGVLGPQLKERKRPDGTYGLTPGPQDRAVEGMRCLLQYFGAENIYIVSRAQGGLIPENWKFLWEYMRRTDLRAENIEIFDGPRSAKAGIVERLKLNCIVDDRYEVLATIPEGVDLVCFRPVAAERARFGGPLKKSGRWVKEVNNWEELCDYLTDGWSSEPPG